MSTAAATIAPTVTRRGPAATGAGGASAETAREDGQRRAEVEQTRQRQGRERVEQRLRGRRGGAEERGGGQTPDDGNGAAVGHAAHIPRKDPDSRKKR